MRAVLEAADGPGIVLSDDPIEGARLTAIAHIKASSNFQDLAEWFASAFDFGPAGAMGAMGGALSDVARHIDAIHELAAKHKEQKGIYDDQAADIDDRMDAQMFINGAFKSSVPLPDGAAIGGAIFRKAAGITWGMADTLMTANSYADLKLNALRDEAQNVFARAGVAPAHALQQIKGLNNEIFNARQELNEKTGPIWAAHSEKFEAAKEANGYNRMEKEAVAIIKSFEGKQKMFALNKPPQYGYSTPESREKFAAWQEALDELESERSALLEPLQNEMFRLFEEANDAAGDLSAVNPFNAEYNAFVEKKEAEIAEAKKFAANLRAHVLEASPISKQAADQWFSDMVLVPKNMQANLKKRGYTPEKLKEDMTEFYRLTGGRLPRISFDTKGGNRAAAQPTTGVVYVAGTFDRATFFHELAHVLEDDERTKALAQRFLDQRTGRDQEGKNKVSRLSTLTGNTRYGNDEVAYPDSFIDPYVGKYYKHGITEVFSMGMQYFSSPEQMAVLAEKDPDHFAFMLGYMATKPRLDAGRVEQQQAAMAVQKDTVETSDVFLKALDKKIAKAGDFWTKEGFEVKKSYGKTWRAVWLGDTAGYSDTSRSLSEKNTKRALWLHISAGKPQSGPYSMYDLTYRTFAQKKITIPKEMAENQSLLEGPAQ